MSIVSGRYARYSFFAAVVAIFVAFTVGVVAGNLYASEKMTRLNSAVQDTELMAQSYVLQQELSRFAVDNCAFLQARLDELSSQLASLGRRLVSQESSDISADEFGLLKRRYHLLEVRAYILLKDLKDSCGYSKPVILYFYSPNDSLSREQGLVLDAVVREHNATVFSIEYGYSDDLSYVENYYRVSATPFIVVDYDSVKQGLVPYEGVISLISGKA